MSHATTVQRVLDQVRGSVDAKKLRRLEETLIRALGRPLSCQLMDEPIVIRRRMVDCLRSEGASEGVVQGFEQLYMGIVRRAAAEGLLPAPPEGPWTRAWQAVLDAADGIPRARAVIRSLAGWATRRDLEPSAIEAGDVEAWSKEMVVKRDGLKAVEQVFAEWSQGRAGQSIPSQRILSERLRKKALLGTVRKTADNR